VEVTVRLDVRLPALGAGRQALQVPSLEGNSAYRIFHGVGRGARQAAEPISEDNRFSKLHCGRCMKPLALTLSCDRHVGSREWCNSCNGRKVQFNSMQCNSCNGRKVQFMQWAQGPKPGWAGQRRAGRTGAAGRVTCDARARLLLPCHRWARRLSRARAPRRTSQVRARRPQPPPPVRPHIPALAHVHVQPATLGQHWSPATPCRAARHAVPCRASCAGKYLLVAGGCSAVGRCLADTRALDLYSPR
jgi:hypothetical protein